MAEQYKVKPGDNLSKIAAQYGMSWQDVYDANKSVIGSNPNLIKEGQTLSIGGTSPVPASSPSSTGAEPQEGDTRTNPTTQKQEFLSPDGTWQPVTTPGQAAGTELVADWQRKISPEAINDTTGNINTTTGEKPLNEITTPEGVVKPEYINQINNPSGWTPSMLDEQYISRTSDSIANKTSAQIVADAKASNELAAKQTDQIATLTRENTIRDLKASLGLDTGTPERTSLVSDYEAMRSKEGVGALETQVNDIEKQIQDTEASLRQGLYKEEGELRPMELIGTRQRELSRQGQELIDTLNRRKSTLVDQLNTKNTMISNIMNLKNQDYSNSVAEYNTKFSQTIQLQDQLDKYESQEEAEKNAVADTARATVTTMMNIASENGGMASMSDDFKVTLSKEAMKSGIPVSAIEALLSSKPGGTIEYSKVTGVDDNGRQTVTSLGTDANGKMFLVNTVTLPGVKTGSDSGMTEAETLRGATSDMGKQLSGVAGEDGYINPPNYRTAKAAWISAGFSGESFDKNFRSYINPKDRLADYGIRE
jgi:LysM repeat protein